jgi:hypothetical protein
MEALKLVTGRTLPNRRPRARRERHRSRSFASLTPSPLYRTYSVLWHFAVDADVDLRDVRLRRAATLLLAGASRTSSAAGRSCLPRLQD